MTGFYHCPFFPETVDCWAICTLLAGEQRVRDAPVFLAMVTVNKVSVGTCPKIYKCHLESPGSLDTNKYLRGTGAQLLPEYFPHLVIKSEVKK